LHYTMHRSPLHFCLLLITLLFFKSEVQAGYFEKVYGNDSSNTGVYFATTADHGLIVLGNSTDSVLTSGYYLFKIDSNGNVVWEKKYIDEFDAFALSLETLNDGKIVLLGTHTGVVYQIVAEIMVFDSAGNFLNGNVYPPFNGWGTAGVSMTHSGDTTVSVIVYNDGFISNNYYSVFSLNQDLSIRWSDFVSFDGSYTQVHGLTSTMNGHVYSMSYYDEYFFGPSPLFKVTHVREHNAAGVLHLDSLYEFNCPMNAIVATSDSGAVICGVQDSSVQKDIVIIKIDSLGNVVWQKQFGSRFNEESNAIIQTRDGGYAILSTIADSILPEQNDLQLLKLSSNGDSLWSHQFGGIYNEIALHIEEDNGDLILMGSTNSFREDQIYIVRTDSTGSIKSPYSIIANTRYSCANDTVSLVVTPDVPPGGNILWSNGETTNPLQVTLSGNYFAIITDSDGVSSQTTITPVYFAAQPNAYFGPDTMHVCLGTILNDTSTGELTNSYQWFLNDTPLFGETNSSLNPQDTGTYKLVVTNYCSSDTSVSYIDSLFEKPVVPVITAPPVNFVCDGDSLPLSISGLPGENYQWYTTDFINNFPIAGATDTLFYAHESGWYLVESRNGNGCNVFSWIYTVNYDLAQEFIDPTGPTQFCKGGEVELSMANGSNFLWSTGDTTQDIFVNSSGEYFVQFINQNNCPKTSDTVTITVFDNPIFTLGADSNICSSDSILLNPGSGFNNYFWNNGSSNPTLIAFSSGPFPDSSEYFVSVLDSNGCSSSDTVLIVFDVCLGLNEITSGFNVLYPNPVQAGSKISILGLEDQNYSLKIIDLLGIVVYERYLEGNNELYLPVNIRNGIYICEIYGNNGETRTLKLMVN
jgi:hypothetical protein